MNHELSTNNLYIRNGEVFRLEKERPSTLADYERLYFVGLVATPTVPNEAIRHSNHRHQAVICCEQFQTIESNYIHRMGWVHLGPDEKKIIGLELEAAEAEFGRWYYFILDTRKHRD